MPFIHTISNSFHTQLSDTTKASRFNADSEQSMAASSPIPLNLTASEMMYSNKDSKGELIFSRITMIHPELTTPPELMS